MVILRSQNKITDFFMILAWASRLCVTGTNLGQWKHNEFRACALLVPNVRLRWSDALLASTFTRGKTRTFLSMQKMCAEVDAHNK